MNATPAKKAPAKRTSAKRAPAKNVDTLDPNVAKLLDPANIEDVSGFDLDAWLDDAKIPQRSVVLYGRADLLAELDTIDQQLRLLSDDDEASVADDKTVDGLEARWKEAALEIEKSVLKVTVRAMIEGDLEAAQEAAAEEGLGPKDDDYASVVGEHIIARVIVEPPMNVDQVRKMASKVGQPQMHRLIQAYGAAGDATRIPTAPFSQPSSRDRRGGTSSTRSGRRGRGRSRR